jgi:hypothetical protein
VIRVGFVLNLSGAGWLGGVSYFRNLFGALRDQPDRRIEAVVITRRDGIALLSHSRHLGRRCPLPALSWIQHRPELFSPAETAARQRQLEKNCRHATATLLSSQAA